MYNVCEFATIECVEWIALALGSIEKLSVLFARLQLSGKKYWAANIVQQQHCWAEKNLPCRKKAASWFHLRVLSKRDFFGLCFLNCWFTAIGSPLLFYHYCFTINVSPLICSLPMYLPLMYLPQCSPSYDGSTRWEGLCRWCAAGMAKVN